MASAISIGDVVRDRFGREGIVCTLEPEPSSDWKREQVGGAEIEKLPRDTRWWGVLPFGGGYLLCPDVELSRLRRASYDDFLAAVDTAGPSGRTRLALTFPDFVDQLLANRKGS